MGRCEGAVDSLGDKRCVWTSATKTCAKQAVPTPAPTDPTCSEYDGFRRLCTQYGDYCMWDRANSACLDLADPTPAPTDPPTDPPPCSDFNLKAAMCRQAADY